MTHIWQGLRSGQWLTASRARGYSLILLAICAIAVAGWIALSDGLIDRNGKPVGTDFSNVYAAGMLTWQGRPAEAYEPALQHAAEKAVFGGREVPFYGWHYPPFFFAVAVVVAAFPYAWGLAIWLAACLAAYLAAMRAILPRCGNAADRGRLPRGVRQHRPRPEWISHRSTARRRAASARSPALARRRADRLPRLQAAIRRS